jgi:CelD/BcsL family acetyltransferase involved in cellulose biosynthesis
MSARLAIDTLKPAQLDSAARAQWNQFRTSDQIFRSPYFDLRYALVAGECAPGAEVAVISRGGRIDGFLPLQRRGRLIQPIAAPLTDYHGILAWPGAHIDLRAVMAALGASRFRFSGLAGGQGLDGAAATRIAMVADLSRGMDVYLGRRGKDFLKDKRRRARRLAEDHGAVEFEFSAEPGEAMDFILRLKRQQMRRTGQHDIFASPWVQRFLRGLMDRRDADFGMRFATLRAGGRLIAAEAGLLSGDSYHLWFPVYDTEFAKYSPGSLATLETLRAAAEEGVAVVDFGPAGETYKRDFADPATHVFEGDVTHGGLVEAARRTADFALAGSPRLRQALSEAGQRVDRRWDRITACEPRLDGQVTAASRSLTAIAARRPGASIGVGVGLGLGASLVSLLAE